MQTVLLNSIKFIIWRRVLSFLLDQICKTRRHADGQTKSVFDISHNQDFSEMQSKVIILQYICHTNNNTINQHLKLDSAMKLISIITRKLREGDNS